MPRAGPVRILVDGPSCAGDVVALRDMIDRLPPFAPRVVAIAYPGNYPDATIAEFAAAFAGGFDRYVCYDWDDLRGRPPGVVAGQLAAGLLAAGVAAADIAVIPDERQAVNAGIEMAGSAGLAVLVMQDDSDPLRSVLAEAGVDGWAFGTVAAWMGEGGNDIPPLVNFEALG